MSKNKLYSIFYYLITSILMCTIIIVIPQKVNAQDNDYYYEEISVLLIIDQVGRFNINAVYAENDFYLAVPELFQLLKINQNFSLSLDTVKGFFITEDMDYAIFYPERLVTIGDKTFKFKTKDFLKTELSLYLSLNVFQEAFGMYCKFYMRKMIVSLKTDLDLPIIRELKVKQIENNLKYINDRIELDTTIARKYNFFRPGAIDYSVSSTQYFNQGTSKQFRLGVGAEVFGGEAETNLRYNSSNLINPFYNRFSWRWANNESRLFKQIKLGNIAHGLISTLQSDVLGAEISNTPTKYRKTYGVYTISDFIEPCWTVHLYINNILIKYTTTDVSGFYSFDIPLVYGNSEVKLKFYGPNGEERIKEKDILVPYNFIPKGKLEYRIKAGTVNNINNAWFSKTELNYGVNKNLTLGGGVEYLRKDTLVSIIPYLNASAILFDNLLLTTNYVPKVFHHTMLNYNMPSNISFRLEYEQYVDGQTTVNAKYGKETSFSVFMPYKLFTKGAYSRLRYKFHTYNGNQNQSLDFVLSNYFGRINTNITTSTRWQNKKNIYLTNDFGISYKLKRNLKIRTRAMIDLREIDLININIEIEKRIKRSGYISISYQYNYLINNPILNLKFSFDFPYVRTSFTSSIQKNRTSTSQGLTGGIVFDSNNKEFIFNTLSNVGRAGFSIIPFLDLNHNGIKDGNEVIVKNLDVRIEGARTIINKSKGIIRAVGLENYTSYIIKLNDNSLEDISWQLKDKVIKAYTDPNQFKQIMIPVYPMGEVAGTVTLNKNTVQKGIGRIYIEIYNEDGELKAQTISESDGYFSYLGLAPGKYYMRINKQQLKKAKLTCIPDKIKFQIKTKKYGDFIENLDFILDQTSD